MTAVLTLGDGGVLGIIRAGITVHGIIQVGFMTLGITAGMIPGITVGTDIGGAVLSMLAVPAVTRAPRTILTVLDVVRLRAMATATLQVRDV